MEQGFKIAIWMLCLTGYLQAKPVTTPATTPVPWSQVKIADLGIGFLTQDEVKCGNETFTHPTNEEESCRHAAVEHFMKQLVLAQEKCNHKDWHINGTLQTLEEKVLPQVPTDTSTCELVTKTSQFEIFVKAIEAFVQNLNSNPTGSGK